MGYASALAWVLLIIISIFTAIYFYTSKYWVYYESKNEAESSSETPLAIASLIMLYPLLWMLSSSFKLEKYNFQ